MSKRPKASITPIQPDQTIQPVESIQPDESIQPVEPVEPVEPADVRLTVEQSSAAFRLNPVEPVEPVHTEGLLSVPGGSQADVPYTLEVVTPGYQPESTELVNVSFATIPVKFEDSPLGIWTLTNISQQPVADLYLTRVMVLNNPVALSIVDSKLITLKDSYAV